MYSKKKNTVVYILELIMYPKANMIEKHMYYWYSIYQAKVMFYQMSL